MAHIQGLPFSNITSSHVVSSLLEEYDVGGFFYPQRCHIVANLYLCTHKK